jgi:hypothetical protein
MVGHVMVRKLDHSSLIGTHLIRSTARARLPWKPPHVVWMEENARDEHCLAGWWPSVVVVWTKLSHHRSHRPFLSELVDAILSEWSLLWFVVGTWLEALT